MYIARNPQMTDLHSLIRENYRQVFFDKEHCGVNLPFHLEREFKRYLTCGNLAYGMARFHCSLCSKDKLVAFSCKGRTLCPSCTGRRMTDTAKHLVEEVIPEVPMRQWVLSMPYAFRFKLGTDPEFLINNAKKLELKNPKVGAITVVQRFGGSLNLNVHFHTLYTDGVFHEDRNGEEQFRQIIPSHEEIIALTKKIKHRLIRLLEKSESNGNEYDWQFGLAELSVQNRDEKFQLPLKIGKVSDPPFKEFIGKRCFYEDGFSLHANIKIPANQRDALEKLCRYILRGPVAKDRITYDQSGGVKLKLKTAFSDGTTHLQFTAEQFIKRIISLIPPPRQNLIRYIGVFGARHKKRSIITAMANPKKQKVKKKIYRTPWGELLKYVFKHEVNHCDYCGTKLSLVATITSSYVCQKIQKNLGLPIEEVNVSEPRGPPELEYFDQSVDYH